MKRFLHKHVALEFTLAIQLIPSVARDVEDTHMVLAKEKTIVDDMELVLIKVLLITRTNCS
jgi:hypothetical protein